MSFVKLLNFLNQAYSTWIGTKGKLSYT